MAKRALVTKHWNPEQVGTSQCQDCEWKATGRTAPMLAPNHALHHGHTVGVAVTSLGVFSPAPLLEPVS